MLIYNCCIQHYNLTSALDLEAQPQIFLPGGVTTSPFHITPEKPQQLGTAEVLNTDESRLLQLTTDLEQNVQAEPDHYTLGQKTINISQWAGRELGTGAEVLPRSCHGFPTRLFATTQFNLEGKKKKKPRARLFLLKRTDPLREI